MHFCRSKSDGHSDKPEDNYGNFDSDEEEKGYSPTPFLKGGKHFDIQAYASNYHRSTKILRLIFIADRFGNANERRRSMQLEALRIAYDIAKKGKDVNVFIKIVRKIDGRLGPNYDMDENWCNSVIEGRRVMSEMLQRCAKNCEKSYTERTICAEDARNVFNSIAVFYEDHGALTRAYAFYKKSVHFCRSDKNYSELLRRLIVVVIELGQFEASAEIAEKGMQYPNLNPITMETLRCALGLARFKSHCYKDAAHQLLGVSKELGNRFSKVMAAHDIATFGALCALATFDPIEFKNFI
ncbi:COP9 signalosome complex subunit 1-like [Cucurbita maxima]|uniref:COP9 signalosome complex subunit 1-like n=1 Tax=Cucurbita maxima TaxID=3661 RepID=A0A6J1KWI7_CUCMA|nr:COP9 signalosome complex subunit 1-like [Cucurbita maxima]